MGELPPGRVGKAPDIQPHYLLWWTAWQDLSTERLGGAIPFHAMREYAVYHKLNLNLLKRIVWGLDAKYLEWQKKKAAKKNG